MNKLFFKFFFLFGLILVGCKHNEKPVTKQNNITSTTHETTINNVTENKILFNIVESFTEIIDENSFVSEKFRLTQKGDNSFILTQKDLIITDVDLSDSGYEGPGFTIYSYKSKQDEKQEIILIEAMADIGTDWYYIVILNDNIVIDKFYIKEPRSNSEITKIQDYISISLIGDIFVFKFKKNKIASYSEIPKNFKRDKDYIYFEKKERKRF